MGAMDISFGWSTCWARKNYAASQLQLKNWMLAATWLSQPNCNEQLPRDNSKSSAFNWISCQLLQSLVHFRTWMPQWSGRGRLLSRPGTESGPIAESTEFPAAVCSELETWSFFLNFLSPLSPSAGDVNDVTCQVAKRQERERSSCSDEG